MEKKIILKGRELDVMKVLWKENETLNASDIAKKGSLSINTVQAALKKLLANKYIRVADIGYSGTVLSRKYVAVISADAFIYDNFLEFSDLKSSLKIFAALIDEETDENTISELEDIIKEKKIKLKME
ncbi:MAG: helix-turn-helix domain-containing protein [Lachnospiraceae bacterium]|nr:helix-turn-helix domain-containing protein [Lachnospiraceae bacterium]